MPINKNIWIDMINAVLWLASDKFKKCLMWNAVLN